MRLQRTTTVAALLAMVLATLWAPGESEPDGIPLLTAAEREAVSAAVLVPPSDTARRLEGADWDDPAAEPPDRPR